MYMLNNNKAAKITLVLASIVALAVLCGKCWADDLRTRQGLEQRAANEMAQCWSDYAQNLNGGGCRFEYHYIDDGQTLWAVEVISDPLN